METHFHKLALEAAKSFLGSVPVDLQLNKYSRGIIEENRKIITSIISCIRYILRVARLSSERKTLWRRYSRGLIQATN